MAWLVARHGGCGGTNHAGAGQTRRMISAGGGGSISVVTYKVSKVSMNGAIKMINLQTSEFFKKMRLRSCMLETCCPCI